MVKTTVGATNATQQATGHVNAERSEAQTSINMTASRNVFLQPEEEQRAAEEGSDQLFPVDQTFFDVNELDNENMAHEEKPAKSNLKRGTYNFGVTFV